jgi:hypothetical protein
LRWRLRSSWCRSKVRAVPEAAATANVGILLSELSYMHGAVIFALEAAIFLVPLRGGCCA